MAMDIYHIMEQTKTCKKCNKKVERYNFVKNGNIHDICNECREKKDEKKLYTVIADAMIPIKVKYTVMAQDEHEAIALIKSGHVQSASIDKPKVKPNHIIQVCVYIGNTLNKILSTRFR